MIFIEHESLYGVRGEVPDDEEHLVPFGPARIAREGSDVTIVGISRMALTAERAAATLAAEHGVEAEVIDPRTLRPLDLDTILASVRRTNRCVIVEEGWPHGGVGANLAALIGEQAFDDLDAPVAARHRARTCRCPTPSRSRTSPTRTSRRSWQRRWRRSGPEPAAAAGAADGEIVMPRLSDTMEEGTILRWLKADGEKVARGEELVEIETDKATMIYESDQAGTLRSLVAARATRSPVGTPIARVGEPPASMRNGSGAVGRPPSRPTLPRARTRPRRRRRPLHPLRPRTAARRRTVRRARQGLAARAADRAASAASTSRRCRAAARAGAS